MDVLAVLGMPLISIVLITIGSILYQVWVVARSPSGPVRCTAVGAYGAVVGYAGALLYGLAFTRPVELCGKKTLDDDYPLRHVTVDVFPPDVACYWSDSDTYGPTHPTALGTWLMWAGVAVAGAGAFFMLIDRQLKEH
jgi:hypothetical protein